MHPSRLLVPFLFCLLQPSCSGAPTTSDEPPLLGDPDEKGARDQRIAAKEDRAQKARQLWIAQQQKMQPHPLDVHRQATLSLRRRNSRWIFSVSANRDPSSPWAAATGMGSTLRWYVEEAGVSIASVEHALPFDRGCSIVELPGNRLLIAGVDLETGTGYLLRLRITGSPLGLATEASVRFQGIDPDEVVYRADEERLYVFDAAAEKLLFAKMESPNELPEESDFTVALDHEGCAQLANPALLLQSGGSRFRGGVTATLRHAKGPEIQITELTNGDWVAQEVREERLTAGWRFGKKTLGAPQAAGPSKMALLSERQRLVAAAGTHDGFVANELERGRRDYLSRDDISKFHNKFIYEYSSHFGHTIDNPVEVVIDLVKTDFSGGVPVTESVGTPTVVKMESRFAADFVRIEKSGRAEEFRELLHSMLTDPGAKIQEVMDEIQASEEFFDAYMRAPNSEARNARILENLHRSMQEAALLSDRTSPSLVKQIARNLSGHTTPLGFIRYSPNGDTLLSIGNGHTNNLRVWDGGTGTLRATVSATRVVSAAFSHDGKRFAIVSEAGSISVWSAQGEQLQTLARTSRKNGSPALPAFTACFGPQGRTLWIGDSQGGVEVRELESGSIQQEFRAHDAAVVSLLPHSRSNLVSSTGFDGADRALIHKDWDGSRGQVPRIHSGIRLDVPHRIMADQRLCVRCERAGIVEIIDLRDGGDATKQLATRNATPSAFAMTTDGSLLALGYDNGDVDLWDVETAKQIETLSGHSSSVLSLDFHPGGLELASGGRDRNLLVWQVPR